MLEKPIEWERAMNNEKPGKQERAMIVEKPIE